MNMHDLKRYLHVEQTMECIEITIYTYDFIKFSVIFVTEHRNNLAAIFLKCLF